MEIEYYEKKLSLWRWYFGGRRAESWSGSGLEDRMYYMRKSYYFTHKYIIYVMCVKAYVKRYWSIWDVHIHICIYI